MAEERIGITIVKDDPCDMCDPETCEGGCLEKSIWERGMTRTEAIEKMARAKHKYEKEINPNMCDWDDYKERAKDEYYRKPAGVMLDALLEEK